MGAWSAYGGTRQSRARTSLSGAGDPRLPGHPARRVGRRRRQSASANDRAVECERARPGSDSRKRDGFSIADAMAEPAYEEEIHVHQLIGELAPALEAAN